ncbi:MULTISPECIES: helix-turn-helix transcriptional regulator [unclassified Methylophaga]|uniref:helix-turn-helix transcriptional regulator n=1 Tax=unclassified Methylophaga TaxID=2629249 RepID=UPI000C959BA7|nr:MULTISPECIES: hypothetical protein [unclassified Methylophaga]MBN46332.1 hypothetical protein [Methylophaga sp.]|tara:strand:+ start:68475 stop:68663 length:189 start_codon:yes stop_codon:yes gene_type:complete
MTQQLIEKITAEEIAAELDYSTRHVKEKLSRKPDFPKAIKIGAKRFWMRQEFKNWLVKQRER